jgi:hypothetical protein
MAGGKSYHQKNPSCTAIQYDGVNAADVVAFAPGYASIEEGKLVITLGAGVVVEVVVGWYIVSKEYPKDVFTFSYAAAEDFETLWEVKV